MNIQSQVTCAAPVNAVLSVRPRCHVRWHGHLCPVFSFAPESTPWIRTLHLQFNPINSTQSIALFADQPPLLYDEAAQVFFKFLEPVPPTEENIRPTFVTVSVPLPLDVHSHLFLSWSVFFRLNSLTVILHKVHPACPEFRESQ
jgi:hypothetical protein